MSYLHLIDRKVYIPSKKLTTTFGDELLAKTGGDIEELTKHNDIGIRTLLRRKAYLRASADEMKAYRKYIIERFVKTD